MSNFHLTVLWMASAVALWGGFGQRPLSRWGVRAGPLAGIMVLAALFSRLSLQVGPLRVEAGELVLAAGAVTVLARTGKWPWFIATAICTGLAAGFRALVPWQTGQASVIPWLAWQALGMGAGLGLVIGAAAPAAAAAASAALAAGVFSVVWHAPRHIGRTVLTTAFLAALLAWMIGWALEKVASAREQPPRA
ncbi:MAG: hypothetical protein M0Z53_04875 [Thermaerobacter sp.]|nr:hypothetical protein [Thermaerobacter sp.]